MTYDITIGNIESGILNAVISETLRIPPSVNFFDKEAAKDYRLGNTGIIIPKGALVTHNR